MKQKLAKLCRSTAWALFVGAAAGAVAAEHEHRHGAVVAGQAQRSEICLRLPQQSLVGQDGRRVRFPEVIDDGRPVLLNFIYTTCTAICPPMSQIFSAVQTRLGADQGRVLMVSVSIDPEQDTPARLREYGRLFGAGPQWLFLTGTARASRAVQEGFDVYRPDKMAHTPVSFLRGAPGQAWLRMDGFATADDLVAELRRMLAGK